MGPRKCSSMHLTWVFDGLYSRGSKFLYPREGKSVLKQRSSYSSSVAQPPSSLYRLVNPGFSRSNYYDDDDNNNNNNNNNVKLQKYFTGEITLHVSTDCKYKTAATLYTLDQGFSNFFGPRHTISLCEI
jgi:hypothetical protein